MITFMREFCLAFSYAGVFFLVERFKGHLICPVIGNGSKYVAKVVTLLILV